MGDYVLFQMWEPHRQSLIAEHLFYVEQARKRLLSQFEDMEAEADKAAEEWLHKNSDKFDPERHDPGEFYENAYDASIEFYNLLSDMCDQTRLGVVAGMFHQWDKQLREWLSRQVNAWHRGDRAKSAIWSADFAGITELLRAMGWPDSGQACLKTLDACRLVVNVYKHGRGTSLEQLRLAHPEYLRHPLKTFDEAVWLSNYSDYTDLKVSDEQLQAFADAIVAFWRCVPKDVFESQVHEVPDWFGKAILKDRSNIKKIEKS